MLHQLTNISVKNLLCPLVRFKRHRRFAAYLLGQFLGTVSSILFRTSLNKSAHAITHRLHKAHTRTVYFLRVSTIISLFLVLTASLSYGASISWTGTSSSSWSDPANWSGGVVPGPGDDVTIPWLPGSANQPVIDVNASIASLSMASNPNTLTVASGVNVTISGNATVGNSATFDTDGGNVTVGGQLSINGNLTMSTGNVTTNSISINNGSSINVNDGHLIINSPSTINGDISLGSGTIDFLGDLTFKGIFNVVDGTVNIGTSSAGATFDLSGSAEFNLNDGTLNVFGPSTLTGSGALNVTGGAINFYDNSTFSGSGKLNAGSGDLYFAQNVTLSGSGTINAESSTIVMDGTTWDMSGNGTFDPGTSTVIFSGSTQFITGSNNQDITFYNLTIDPGATVTADIPVSVTNNYVNNGTFNPSPPNQTSSASITQQPVSQEVCEGSSVTLFLTATGASSYQWQKNNSDITGANSATLTFNNISMADMGLYVCIVTDGSGNKVYSDPAVLTVNSLPSVVLSSSSSAVCPGSSVALTADNSGGNVSTVTKSTYDNIKIPDNNATGISSNITLPSGSSIPSDADLEVSLTIAHTWVGDLKVTLTGPGGVGSTTLFDKPGTNSSRFGNGDDLVSTGNYIFSTAGSAVIPETSVGGTVPTGTYLPSSYGGSPNNFSGINFPVSDASGTWKVSISDNAGGDLGTLIGWSLTVKYNGTYTTYFSGPGTIGTVSYSGTYNEVATASATLPSAPGSYTYTATTSDPNGCSATDTVRVHVMDSPVYTPSPDTTICNGGTANLRVTLPVDSAMQFDGSSSYVGIANSPDINTYSSSSILKNRTVALWFKANDVSTRQVLYEEGAGVNGFSIYIEGGYLYVHGWESNTTWTSTPIRTSISPNTWYNAAFVYNANATDGQYFKGYLNGNYFGSTSDINASNGMNPHSGDINIGRSDGIRFPDNNTYSGNYFNGEIDEFKLWNRSLTSEEVFNEQFSHVVSSNEIVYYNFNNDSGTNVVDEAGGDNPGTASGTVHSSKTPFQPTVSWAPGGGTGTNYAVTPTSNTTYTYTLTEPLVGCTTTGNIAVTVSNVTLAAITTNETCTGTANGAINLTPSGGVAPYSYAWSTADGSGLNATSEDQTNLSAGTYDVAVTDANGCTAGGSYTIVAAPDNANPTITAPSDINQVADNGVCTAAVSVPNPTYSDNCSVASLLWEMTGATVDNSAGSGINSVGTYTFNKGTTTITWTVTDAAGNSAQASMNVTVTDDQNPSITAPADVAVSADAGTCSATNVTLGSPTTSDNCGVGSVANDAPASFPEGTTVVTWTVTDNSGNTATATQNVTVTDDEKPVIADLSDLSTSVCASDETASPQYEVVNGIGLPAGRISDNCSSTFTITYTISGATTVTNGTGDASGTTFYEGISTVTYYVKDESGNVSDGKSFTVTVDHKPNTGNIIAN